MDALPREGKQASLDGSFRWMMHRSMRAVKNNLSTPLRNRPSLRAQFKERSDPVLGEYGEKDVGKGRSAQLT
jgi:hypothetical protein